MKVSCEKVEGSKVVLTVESPANVVDEALEKAYKSVVKRVNVPGFRRGKAPRFILERHFGKGILFEDAAKELLPSQYAEAVKEAKIDPIDEPEFDDINLKQGEPLTFKATVYVMPEVSLEDYSGITVAYEAPTVTEEDIDQQVTYLRERMAELRPLEDDEALAAGDYATCHVKGIEGGTFKAEIDRDLSYVDAGAENAMVPGLGPALIGMKKGETKEFSGTYPAEPLAEAGEKTEDAGDAARKPVEEPKEARFHVEVKECHRKHLPTDEDFVKNLSKDTMDEVREDLKTRIMAMKVESAKRAHSDKVEEALLEKATVEIPDVLVNRKQQELFDRFIQRLSGSGTNADMFFPKGRESVEEVFNSFAPQAQKEAKRELVLDAIAKKEGVTVSEEAVNGVVETIAKEMGKETDVVKTTLDVRGALSGIKETLLRVEATKKIAVEAAARAGTPLPEDVPPAAEGEPAEAGENGAGPEIKPEVDSETLPDAEPENEKKAPKPRARKKVAEQSASSKVKPDDEDSTKEDDAPKA